MSEKNVGFVNIYGNKGREGVDIIGVMYRTTKEADQAHDDLGPIRGDEYNRVARVKIEYTDGQMDE